MPVRSWNASRISSARGPVLTRISVLGTAGSLPSSEAMDELWTVQLGVVEYREAYALQERVRAARQAGTIPDTVLMLEHEPVYTHGRRTAPGELAMGEEWYRSQGIDVVGVDRGGKVTYHGPG